MEEERARGSFEALQWGYAIAELSAAHREGQLGRGSRATCGCRIHGRERRLLQDALAGRASLVVAWQGTRPRSTLCLLGARPLPRRPGPGNGMGRLRRTALGGEPPPMRRAGLAADVHGLVPPVRGRAVVYPSFVE